TDINVTPLVDVVLVLLIVLMVTATAIASQSIPMDLPQGTTGEASDAVLEVAIDRQGQFFADGVAVDAAGLDGAIAAAAGREGIRARISADRAVAHGSVVELMDRLRRGGIMNFAIAMDAPPAESAAP
ncbi:MAG: biopolymer transporter ExbD, partial [Myxococcota bacterium]